MCLCKITFWFLLYTEFCWACHGIYDLLSQLLAKNSIEQLHYTSFIAVYKGYPPIDWVFLKLFHFHICSINNFNSNYQLGYRMLSYASIGMRDVYSWDTYNYLLSFLFCIYMHLCWDFWFYVLVIDLLGY